MKLLEIAKNGILSPVRLPFRHTDNGHASIFAKVARRCKPPIHGCELAGAS
jgi:hypothetical protein